MDSKKKVAILGGGNIGLAIANGLVSSKLFPAKQIYITKRKIDSIRELGMKGFKITSNNLAAVKDSDIIIVAVQPKQLDELLVEITPVINEKKHIIISVVSSVSIKVIKKVIGQNIPVVRAMPNTAIAIKESMTCIASDIKTNGAIKIAEEIFGSLGKTLIIE